MLDETNSFLRLLLGGVPSRSGRLRQPDAYAQVRGELRLREARRMRRKSSAGSGMRRVGYYASRSDRKS